MYFQDALKLNLKSGGVIPDGDNAIDTYTASTASYVPLMRIVCAKRLYK